jgi:aspartate/methionine/tyrosine aminotransferase
MSTVPERNPHHYAERLARIAPFHVVELLERAKALEAAGRRVIHLEVGEPDFPTAAPIVAAGHRALDSGATKYTQALGIPELRERIADYYRTRLGIDVAAQRIVVTSGASAGLLLLCGLLLNPGDELLLTDPGYPCNEVFARLVNAGPVRVPLSAEAGFALDVAEVAARWTGRTRGLLIASPANPTGAMLDAGTLAALAALARERAGFVILDEIYQGLVFDGQGDYPSGLAVADDLFVLNSFSKYFGMTGWRLGWMVVPESALDGVTRLAQNLFISPPSLSQYAALAAFGDEAMAIHEARRVAFARRRDRLVAGLEELGFRVPLRPPGAFYVYADVSRSGLDSMEFCWRLLEEFGVAATPGADFGEHAAGRFVRFAFTTAEEAIAEAVERMGTALAAWTAR